MYATARALPFAPVGRTHTHIHTPSNRKQAVRPTEITLETEWQAGSEKKREQSQKSHNRAMRLFVFDSKPWYRDANWIALFWSDTSDSSDEHCVRFWEWENASDPVQSSNFWRSVAESLSFYFVLGWVGTIFQHFQRRPQYAKSDKIIICVSALRFHTLQSQIQSHLLCSVCSASNTPYARNHTWSKVWYWMRISYQKLFSNKGWDNMKIFSYFFVVLMTVDVNSYNNRKSTPHIQ